MHITVLLLGSTMLGRGFGHRFGSRFGHGFGTKFGGRFGLRHSHFSNFGTNHSRIHSSHPMRKHPTVYMPISSFYHHRYNGYNLLGDFT